MAHRPAFIMPYPLTVVLEPNPSKRVRFSRGHSYTGEFANFLSDHFPCYQDSKDKRAVVHSMVKEWLKSGGTFWHGEWELCSFGEAVVKLFQTLENMSRRKNCHQSQPDITMDDNNGSTKKPKTVTKNTVKMVEVTKPPPTNNPKPPKKWKPNQTDQVPSRKRAKKKSLPTDNFRSNDAPKAATAGKRDEAQPRSGTSAEECTLADNAGDNDEEKARRLSYAMMTFFQQFDAVNGLFMGDECRDKFLSRLDDIEHNMKVLTKKLSETTQAKPRQVSPTNENDQEPANLKADPNETGPELRVASIDETREGRHCCNEGQLKNTKVAVAAFTDDSDDIIGRDAKRLSDVVITFFQQLDSTNGLFMGDKFGGKILSRLENIERNVNDLNKKVELARKG